MRRASRVIADAAAAVIAAQIVTALRELPVDLPGELPAEIAAATAKAAVQDLTDAGWYITHLPAHLHHLTPEGPR